MPVNKRKYRLLVTPTLQRMREVRELTLEEVATKCRCDRSAITRWERRITEPKPEFRKAYAECLGMTVGELGRLVYEDSVR
jgi:transcriptional regulator with XRE-family HTH domain